MKNLFKVILAVMIFAAFAAVSVFADASGEMYYVYTNPTSGNSSVIVNNTWEYVESSKTLYIRSLTDGYNETGRTSYAEDGAWDAYSSSIEHIVLVGNFNKITGQAFKEYRALKDIFISGNTQQYDSECFNGCSNLQSITVRGEQHVAGYANIKTAKTINGNNHFAGTKLTTFNLGSSTTLKEYKALNQFNEGSTIMAYATNPAYAILEESGLFTLIDNTPIDVKVVLDGRTYDSSFEYGTSNVFQTINGMGVMLFHDEEFSTPYQNTPVENGDVFYAAPIISSLGSMVRVEDHQGLRSIFEFDKTAFYSITEYTVKEFGCIAKKMDGLLKELYYEDDDIYNVKVYSNGVYMGNILSTHNNTVRYAYTAVGYETNGALSVENAETDLLFRGYVVLTDSNGNDMICYTDIIKMDLATACKKTLDVNNESTSPILSSKEAAFVGTCLDAGAMPNYIYTKDELLSTLTAIYNDTEHYIPAQHLGVGKNALSDYLDISDKTVGTLPAMVSFDFEGMTTYNANGKALISTVKEYIEKGGIVSFSYHMENPTGNYTDDGLCRGELGGEATWKDLVTPGTDLNENFNTILDKAAVILKELDDGGYPILWRPLHEMNGDWFWWCTIQGWSNETEYVISQEAFKALWIYIYEYFTDTWGMKHLIWVYSPSPSTNMTVSTSGTLPVMYCYPGDEYCDIVGGDWYVGRDKSITEEVAYLYNIDVAYEQLIETGKPVALTEFGPSSSSMKADVSKGEKQEDIFSCRDQLEIVTRMQNEGLKLTYVLNWSGWISMHNIGYMDELFAHESALDLHEIKTMFDTLYKNR